MLRAISPSILALPLLAMTTCRAEDDEPIDDVMLRQYAAALCAAAYACDCADPPFFDEEHCTQELYKVIRRGQLRARVVKATFDEACAQEHIEIPEALGCKNVDELVAAAMGGQAIPSSDCQVFHGARKEGERCEIIGVHMSDCAQGLECRGRCIDRASPDPAFLLAEGERCREEYLPLGQCADELWCSFDSDHCERLPPAGTPCSTDTECNLPSIDLMYCDAGTCTPFKWLGEACSADDECRDAACMEGICTSLDADPFVCMAIFL